ncbi:MULTISPECIES: phage holin family protein [Corynebacterium]|uniref:Membrane protein n=1 Tax=Corynebacterium minutissimum TaxID=38301 RepID=A0A2X4RGN9_9CORY|nr:MULTISPECIES: phage holin family protein [Corynebacterium]KHO30532.1 membrane protein [Corynebacterium minutissimum]MBU5655025.1 phage holin family protein [Corynebacterium aurimucosum]MCG7228460.1 phage holin family protein [Corynebacterium minutissimum]MCG7237578.1 phage holin family protein [Corynebacterium minutissimum]MDK6813838.1 phage holin family protein [Corynebacterium sp. UMB6689]
MKTFINFALNVIAVAVAFWAVVAIVPGIDIVPASTQNFLLIAAVFIIVNEVVTPVLRFLGAPLTCLTLGLFALVINGAVLLLVSALMDSLVIDGWGAAIIGAIVLAIVSGVVNFFTSPLRSRN